MPKCISCEEKIAKETLCSGMMGEYYHTRVCVNGHIWMCITYGTTKMNWTQVLKKDK